MNKKLVIGLVIVLLAFGGLVILGKAQPSDNQPKLTFTSITQDVSKGAVLYDVRTPDEYKEGHFTGSVNFPLQTLQQGTMPTISKTAKIYLYCNSGSRSSQAAVLLKDAGYKNVTDLQGLSNVQAMGGKLVTE